MQRCWQVLNFSLENSFFIQHKTTSVTFHTCSRHCNHERLGGGASESVAALHDSETAHRAAPLEQAQTPQMWSVSILPAESIMTSFIRVDQMRFRLSVDHETRGRVTPFNTAQVKKTSRRRAAVVELVRLSRLWWTSVCVTVEYQHNTRKPEIYYSFFCNGFLQILQRSCNFCSFLLRDISSCTVNVFLSSILS